MRNIDARYVVAAIALAGLGVLLYWQHRREAMVADCVTSGGRWDGPSSTCRLPNNRILTRPGLRRG